jgi:DNA (cytosine-5)-methyltransferase 1
MAKAGFKHESLVEWDADACGTLLENKERGEVLDMKDWPIHNADVRKFDFSSIKSQIDVLAAGVPCQPFSIGGKHMGHEDERNMFPELLNVVRELKPRAVLVENVRGLARPSFAKYFSYIHFMLSYPEIIRKDNEEWTDHLARLEKYHTKGKRDGLYYRVVPRVVNAADYGVPQKRERVFIVALRSDLGLEWSFPKQTHSLDSLLYSQFVSGEYWDRHKVAKKKRPAAAGALVRKVESLRGLMAPTVSPWRTVRDAIADLPKPAKTRKQDEPNLTHFEIPGARVYPGHTGSPLDDASKTLKAGDHGVPGGENMVAYPDGSVRYFTIRESARIQTFPDNYVFSTSWTESMRQLGNAVPMLLAEKVATKLHDVLTGRI